MKVIIDNQVIVITSGIFSIRPISRFTEDELKNIPVMSWGSHLLDNKVISLLMTNHISMSELSKIKKDDINDRISGRYFQLLSEKREKEYIQRKNVYYS